MTKRNNDITLTIAVLLLVIIVWMSRANQTGRSVVNENDNRKVEEVDSLSLYAVCVDTSIHGLNIYYPITDSIVLRCFERPNPEKDSLVVFCCAAAFTRFDRPHKNNHTSIAGDHVSSGKRMPGYPCKNNTGAVVFYNGSWKFLFDSYSHELDSAALHGGSGFAQEMLIHENKPIETVRPLSDVNHYRALCQIGDKLCIIDSREIGSFGTFINRLLDVGVHEAIYMDMGEWHYSWYRTTLGGGTLSQSMRTLKSLLQTGYCFIMADDICCA